MKWGNVESGFVIEIEFSESMWGWGVEDLGEFMNKNLDKMK